MGHYKMMYQRVLRGMIITELDSSDLKAPIICKKEEDLKQVELNGNWPFFNLTQHQE